MGRLPYIVIPSPKNTGLIIVLVARNCRRTQRPPDVGQARDLIGQNQLPHAGNANRYAAILAWLAQRGRTQKANRVSVAS